MNQQIVLVDDEQGVLDLQRDALAEIGLSSETFTSSSAAWERISRGDVSLVVTDWDMPGMSGVVLLFKITGMELPPCVIVLTALNTMSHAAQARDEGAYDFLVKPLDIPRYQQVIKSALEYHCKTSGKGTAGRFASRRRYLQNPVA